MRKMVKQFIRDANHDPIGVVVAIPNEENGYNLGWSVCNKHDKFHRETGTSIAIGRAYMGVKSKVPNRTIRDYVLSSERTVEDDDVYEEIFLNTVQETIHRVKSRADRFFNKVNS